MCYCRISQEVKIPEVEVESWKVVDDKSNSIPFVMHSSVPRNPLIVYIFYFAGLIEEVG